MDIETLKNIKNKICKNKRKIIKNISNLGKILPKKVFPVLKNERGNFCFVNAFTQLLYSMDSFMEFISNANFDNLEENDKKLLNSLQEYYKNILNSNNNFTYKENLEKIIPEVKRKIYDNKGNLLREEEIIRGQQNDASELLLSLFNLLDKNKKNNDLINNFLKTIEIIQKEIFYENQNNFNQNLFIDSRDNPYLILLMPFDLLQSYFQNINNIIYEKLEDIPTIDIEKFIKYINNPNPIESKYNYNDALKITKYQVPKDNKYILISNVSKRQITYNESRTIILNDENKIDVSYKLLGFIAHHGNIDYKTSSSPGGHYVYYYTNNNDIQLLDDNRNTPLTNDELITKYKEDYQHPYFLLFERIDDNLPSGGGYKITKKNKIKNNNSNKHKRSKKSKYFNKYKRSNKKISRHNKKYN